MGNNNDYNEKLYKFIKKCQRYHYKPDLHSFTVETDRGIAFVECDTHEIDIYYDVDGNHARATFSNAIDATLFLEYLNARLDTISM